MSQELGTDTMQGHAQEGGGHNVHHDIMGDPCQSGVTPLCACSDPISTVLCRTQLAQIPHPVCGFQPAPLPGHGCVVPQ